MTRVVSYTLWRMPAFASVDDYIDAQSPAAQTRLRELRAIVRGAVPGAAEVIAYDIPTYRWGPGSEMVSIGAAKRHVALYGGAMDACADELAEFQTSKGTVKFPLDKPIPEALVRKLVLAKAGRA